MKTTRAARIVIRIISAMFLLLLVACGGGTSGTGTGERSFEGVIVSETGAPIAGASVTIVETGEGSVTDQAGAYVIISEVQGTRVALLIETAEISTTVQVETVDTENSAVRVDVTLDSDSPAPAVEVSKLQVTAKVVGACDPYFENRRTIRQANRIPEGTVCSAKVELYGDGRLLERIPFVIQHADCDGTKWKPVSESETGFGVHAGVGTATFTYFNEPEYCLYRIVAPYQVPGLDSVVYRIDTFLKQAEDAKE